MGGTSSPHPLQEGGSWKIEKKAKKKKNTIGVGPEHFTLIKGEAYFAYLAR